MASSNPTRFLTDAAGDPRGLALKVFRGTVLEAFRLQTVFYDDTNRLVDMKRVSGGGKSEQYPIIGFDPTPEYHQPGDELLGQQQPFSEIVITIDDILVGHRDVPHDQTLISHFPVIEPYAKAIGKALAVDLDGKVARTGIIAARTPALAGFHNGGNVVSRVGGGTTIKDCYPATPQGAANLRDDASELAQLLTEDNVPETGRYLILTPYGLRVLMKDTQITSKDYDPGNANQLLNRVLTHIEGFDVMVSNGIPNRNYLNSGSLTNPTKYDVDCRYVAGNVAASTGQPIAIALCGASEGNAAVGMVIAEDFYTAMLFDERRNTTFLKGQNMVGLGVVAPYMAGEIRGQLS